MNSYVKSVIVVGGGTAGWMAAGYYSKKGYATTLIESSDIGVVGVGESTLPAMNWFANYLGTEEEEWMPLSNSVFKLAIKHEGWNGPDSNWWHWFIYDRTKNKEQFEHLKNNTLPAREKLEYGYHIDAFKFGNTIAKTVALKHGCKHIIGHVTEVIGDSVTGIQKLVTTNGRELTADFYIDCTGWRKVLANKVGMKYRRYEHLVNDRAITTTQPSLPNINRYTTTIAKSAGWIWEIPLTTRRGCGYVYSSKYITDEEAVEEYCTHYPGTDRSKLNFLKFTPEVCLNPVNLNVVCVGLAGGFIEPLEATSIFLTQYMIMQSEMCVSGERTANAINRSQQKVFDHTAKFVLCHYTLSGRTDTAYWRYFNDLEKTLNTLDYVKEKANEQDVPQWKSTNLFFPCSWWALLNGGYNDTSN